MEITATWADLWTEKDTEELKQAALAVRDRVEKLSTAGSADLIALELESRQVKAVCENPYACAIAEDLNRVLKELGVYYRWEVYVAGDGTVQLQDSVNFVSIAQIVYSTEDEAHPLSEFITNFDYARYPNLIDNTRNDL